MARGQNGVILKEFLGIADVRELLVQFDHGVTQDLAMFPLCIPKIVPCMLFNEVSTMMIAGVWRKYRTILPEEKWSLLASFNVMQFFAYNASTTHKDREYYLKQFNHTFTKIFQKLIKNQETLEQYVLGDAVDLKSNDVVHTLISLIYVKLNMADTYAKINIP